MREKLIHRGNRHSATKPGGQLLEVFAPEDSLTMLGVDLHAAGFEHIEDAQRL
jgi:hypothetical protein